MTDEQKCSERMIGRTAFQTRACSISAKHEHDGRMYCSHHYPPFVEAKNAKRRADQDKARDDMLAEIHRRRAAEAEQARRADLYPELLECLCALVLNHDAGGVTLGALRDARIAIAKATGEIQ